MREKYSLSVAFSSELREGRIRHELLEHVPGDVSAEQPLDLSLLAPFDEVLIAEAAEGGEDERDGRLRDRDPDAAREEPHRHGRIGRDEQRGAEKRPSKRKRGEEERGKESRRRREQHPRSVARRPQEAARQHIVRGIGMDLDTGHSPAFERCLKHVPQAGRGDANEHDLVAESRGIQAGLQARYLFLRRIHHLIEGVSDVRTGPAILEKRRTAEVDERPDRFLPFSIAERGDALAQNRHVSIPHDDVVLVDLQFFRLDVLGDHDGRESERG
jgi:hypothetical protein